MMEDLVMDILKGAIRIAIVALGKDRTQAILDAEYAAADALADKLEEAKLSGS